MSYNGSGTFLINSAGQPVVANTVISATVFNALTSDLATGLSTAITKDGQTTITANIPFGSNKITGLGSGTAATDAANLGQVQSTAAKLVTVTGTDTITGSMSPQLTAYAAGQLFYFVAAGANTGAVTINIDGLGAKSVTRDGSTALANGDINSGEVVVVIYDGTRFQMINAANSFGNTTINGTLTVTGNTGLQANVSITSTLSVGGTFAVTGAATLGSTLAVTGKSDLPTVSTASMNAAVALITTGTVTNLTASGASIASANIGNLQFTAASIASINAGVAIITNLTATGASIASANVGNAVITAATVTGASIASANVGTAVITTGTVTNLTSTSASVASINAAVALITTGTVTALTATGASVASANVGTAVVTGLTVTNASIASLNAGTATVTSGNLTFSSTAQRITGDMSNATLSNRLTFQSSITNGNTAVQIVPNGTAIQTQIGLFSDSAFANGNYGDLTQNNSEFRIRTVGLGSGTAVPMTFSVNGSERMRLDTSGNLGIGTASPKGKLDSTTGDNAKGLIVSGATNLLRVYPYFNFGGNNRGTMLEATNVAESAYGDISISGNAIQFLQGAGTLRAIIDSSGNVGIGTASPESGFKLHVVGNAFVQNTAGQTVGKVVVDNVDQRLVLASYFEAGVGQYSYISSTDNAETGNTNLFFRTGTTDRMVIDSSGNVGIGGTGFAFDKVVVTGTLPTNSNVSLNYSARGTAPSGTTTTLAGFNSFPATAAASFTCTDVIHFNAAGLTIGAGSTVTNQYGFRATDQLTGATNNYGFYSNIASGSNRWNFYAAGTARNYFAGNTGVGADSGTAYRFRSSSDSTAVVALAAFSTAGSDSGTEAIKVSKFANDTTTAQVFVRFVVNNDATTSGQINANGANTAAFGTYSDARLKENIVDLPSQLANICALRPVEFDYKTGGHQIGFVAQEMQEIYSDVVGAGKDGILTITGWSKTEARLVKAIQELAAKVAALEAR